MRNKTRISAIFFTGIAIIVLLSAFVKHEEPHPYKIEYPAYFGNRFFIPEDNPTTVEGVALGRMLFYETALSSNNKISCATCHQQEYAFTDRKDFSEGVDGFVQPRNTMSLTNLLWVQNFFWDARTKGLENQADSPLIKVHEMGQAIGVAVQKLKEKKIYNARFEAAFGDKEISPGRIKKALAQFERTLISCNSRYDQYLQGKYQPSISELNGIELFFNNPDPGKNIRGAACGHCHAGPKTYQEMFHNNGLDAAPKDVGRAAITGQAYDIGRFRVVSLRNIGLTAPYMHDARFKTLEEVVDHYSDHIADSPQLSPFLKNNSNNINGTRLGLTSQEKKDLLAFLNMLTDSGFITDKRFSNPFTNN